MAGMAPISPVAGLKVSLCDASMPDKVRDLLGAVFAVWEPANVLVCKLHQVVVPSDRSSIFRHLGGQGHSPTQLDMLRSLPGTDKGFEFALEAYYRGAYGRVPLADPSAFVTQGMTPPCPHLPPPDRRYYCSFDEAKLPGASFALCSNPRKRTASRKRDLYKHLAAHFKELDREMTAEDLAFIKCGWFQDINKSASPGCIKCIHVTGPCGGEPPASPRDDDGTPGSFTAQEAAAAFAPMLAPVDAPSVLEAPNHSTDSANMFVELAGWMVFFAGASHPAVVALRAAPSGASPADKALRALDVCMPRFRDWVSGSAHRLESAGSQVLRLLEQQTSSRTGSSYHCPSYGAAREKTQSEYWNYWGHVLRVVVRTWSRGDGPASSGDGLPPMDFSGRASTAAVEAPARSRFARLSIDDALRKAYDSLVGYSDSSGDGVTPPESASAKVNHALLGLSLALVEAETGDVPLRMPLLWAVASLCVVDGGWQIASRFGKTLSGVLWVAKGLLLRWAEWERDSSADNDGADGESVAAAGLWTSFLRPHLDSWYLLGPSSHRVVLGCLHDLRNLAIAQSHNEPGLKATSFDGSVIVHNSKKTHMFAIREGVQRSMEDLERQLHDLLLVPPATVPADGETGAAQGTSSAALDHLEREYPLPPLTDDWNDRREGTSISTLLQLLGGEPTGDRIIRRILASPSLRERWIVRDGGSTRVSALAKHEYLEAAHKFILLLVVVLYLVCGTGPRGTEMATLRHTNTAQGGQRNMLFDAESGLWGYGPRYHKSITRSLQGKDRWLFMPPRLSRIFTFYMLIILPHIQRLMRGEPDAQSPYLCFGSPGSQLERPVKEARDIAARDDAEQTAPRQAAAGDDDLAHEYEVLLDDDAFQQHDAGPPRRRGALDFSRSPGPITDARFRVAVAAWFEGIGTQIGVADWRHMSTCIMRHITERVVPDAQDPASDLRDAFNAQAGHSSLTAAVKYGNGGHGALFMDRGLLYPYLQVSCLWHAVVGGESLSLPAGSRASSRLPTYMAGIASPMRLLAARDVEDRLRQQVRILAREAACRRSPEVVLDIVTSSEGRGFRPGQKEAFLVSVSGVATTVCVLGTGVGKSLLYLARASMGGLGITLVLAPFVRLCAEIRDRAEASGIPAITSDMAVRCGCIPPATRLIVASAESITNGAFGRIIHGALVEHRIDEVFFDEGHCMLDALVRDRKWRPASVDVLCVLHAVPRWVLLTATLPPSAEGLVLEVLSSARLGRHQRIDDQLDAHGDGRHQRPVPILVVRQPTLRRNLRLSCVQYDDMAEVEAEIRRFLDRPLPGNASPSPSDKLLVIGSGRIATFGSLADALGTTLYCSSAGDDVASRPRKMEAVMGRWTASGGVMVATSVVGVGMDLPDIPKLVLVLDIMIDAIELSQAVGRAARGGAATGEIIVMVNRSLVSQHAGGAGAGLGKQATLDFATATSCRRSPLGHYLDGTPLAVRCDPECEVLCDLCESRLAADYGARVLGARRAGDSAVPSWCGSMDGEAPSQGQDVNLAVAQAARDVSNTPWGPGLSIDGCAMPVDSGDCSFGSGSDVAAPLFDELDNSLLAAGTQLFHLESSSWIQTGPDPDFVMADFDWCFEDATACNGDPHWAALTPSQPPAATRKRGYASYSEELSSSTMSPATARSTPPSHRRRGATVPMTDPAGGSWPGSMRAAVPSTASSLLTSVVPETPTRRAVPWSSDCSLMPPPPPGDRYGPILVGSGVDVAGPLLRTKEPRSSGLQRVVDHGGSSSMFDAYPDIARVADLYGDGCFVCLIAGLGALPQDPAGAARGHSVHNCPVVRGETSELVRSFKSSSGAHKMSLPNGHCWHCWRLQPPSKADGDTLSWCRNRACGSQAVRAFLDVEGSRKVPLLFVALWAVMRFGAGAAESAASLLDLPPGLHDAFFAAVGDQAASWIEQDAVRKWLGASASGGDIMNRKRPARYMLLVGSVLGSLTGTR